MFLGKVSFKKMTFLQQCLILLYYFAAIFQCEYRKPLFFAVDIYVK